MSIVAAQVVSPSSPDPTQTLRAKATCLIFLTKLGLLGRTRPSRGIDPIRKQAISYQMSIDTATQIAPPDEVFATSTIQLRRLSPLQKRSPISIVC